MIPLSMEDASILASNPPVLKASKPYLFDLAGAGRALDQPLAASKWVSESGPALRLAPQLGRADYISGDILSKVLPTRG